MSVSGHEQRSEMISWLLYELADVRIKRNPKGIETLVSLIPESSTARKLGNVILGTKHNRVGDIQGLTDLLASLPENGTPQAQIVRHIVRCDLLLLLRNYEEACAEIKAGIEDARKADDFPSELILRHMYAYAFVPLQRYADSLTQFDELLCLLKEQDSIIKYGSVMGNKSQCLFNAGELQQAIRAGETSAAVLAEAGDLVNEGAILNALALYELLGESFDPARLHASRALFIHQNLNFPKRKGRSAAILASIIIRETTNTFDLANYPAVQLQCTKWAEALELFKMFEYDRSELYEDRDLFACVACYALCAHRLGMKDKARTIAQAAQKIVSSDNAVSPGLRAIYAPYMALVEHLLASDA